MESPQESSSALSPAAIVILALLAGAAALLSATGNRMASLLAVVTAASEATVAGLIVLSAGGYGYAVIRRIAPPDAPKALVAATAAGVGVWMLSTTMLIVGSLTTGLLRGWLWWPIVAVGVLLAGWWGRKSTEGLHLPRRLDGRTLIWVLLAVAVGLWISGATRSPGVWQESFSDEYDVLEYHLQVPREYYNNQHITGLDHNCYSHYPLGVEMLYLLAMCLRGGAYEGVFLAKFTHGMFAILSVVAIWGTLRREEELRGRLSAVLLATAPLTIYMSWLGMVELAEVFYMTLALLWLRQWIAGTSPRSAVCLGLALGGACAVKYLSVGFVVVPVAAVMLGIGWKRLTLVGHTLAALALTGLLFSPWLVRNTLLTGNPVFPLATQYFGKGHWPGESRQRWVDGHSSQRKPPVPAPADWQMPPQPTSAELFYQNFMMSQWFGPLLKLLAGLAVCALFASAGRTNTWDWALAAVWVIQLAVWVTMTQGMPPRFLMPALAPMSLLAGGLLVQVSRIQANPLRSAATRPEHGPWGMALAVAAFIAAAGINLAVAYGVFRDVGGRLPAQGVSADQIAGLWPWKQAQELPPDSRILTVGEAKAFYLPKGTIYATAFDDHPLAAMAGRGLSPAEMIAELRRMGVTHLWVDWPEILRLSHTYGYPSVLSDGLVKRLSAGLHPSIPILELLQQEGLKVYQELDLPTPPAASAPASQTATSQATQPVGGPVITIYALPGILPIPAETTTKPR